MATSVVRLPEAARVMLRDSVSDTGEPMRTVLVEALDAYRRQVFFDRVDAAYAALQADPVAWQEELDERAAWDATLLDGLEGD